MDHLLDKGHTLSQEAWAGAQESAFLTAPVDTAAGPWTTF